MKEINVIGTMQLLAACQKAPSVRRLVRQVDDRRLRRLARATRRCSPRTCSRGACPAAATPRTPSRSRATCAASPAAVPTSTSRAAVRQLHRPADRHAADPLLPAAGRADRARLRPALQLLHEDDALEVLRPRQRPATVAGTVNVGGEGVLLLSQAIRRPAGSQLPVPGARASRSVGRLVAPAASSTSRRSRCASSTSAGSSTRPAAQRVRLHARGTRPRRPATTSPRTGRAGGLARTLVGSVDRPRRAAPVAAGRRHGRRRGRPAAAGAAGARPAGGARCLRPA